MEFRLQPLGFIDLKKSHQAVKKMIFLTAWWLMRCKKLHETQGSQSKFLELNI